MASTTDESSPESSPQQQQHQQEYQRQQHEQQRQAQQQASGAEPQTEAPLEPRSLAASLEGVPKADLVACLVAQLSGAASKFLGDARRPCDEDGQPLVFRDSVELPEGKALSVDDAADLRQGLRVKMPGKRVELQYLIPRRQLEVQVYAGGGAHNRAVTLITHRFETAIDENGLDDNAVVTSDALHKLGAMGLAPDLIIHSNHPWDVEPGDDGCPITFVGEVEYANRSLRTLIDHLASIMDVGSVNGVLGVKCFAAQRRAVLFVVRKRRDLDGSPAEVTHAYDFGPEPMPAEQLAAASARMQQRFGAAPAQWTRAPGGAVGGQGVVVEIPFEFVVRGVLDAAGGAVLDLAAAVQHAAGGWEPVRLELVKLLRRFRL